MKNDTKVDIPSSCLKFAGYDLNVLRHLHICNY